MQNDLQEVTFPIARAHSATTGTSTITFAPALALARTTIPFLSYAHQPFDHIRYFDTVPPYTATASDSTQRQ